jgi:hypothetical protein
VVAILAAQLVVQAARLLEVQAVHTTRLAAQQPLTVVQVAAVQAAVQREHAQVVQVAAELFM